jgi:hypothetical protein
MTTNEEGQGRRRDSRGLPQYVFFPLLFFFTKFLTRTTTMTNGHYYHHQRDYPHQNERGLETHLRLESSVCSFLLYKMTMRSPPHLQDQKKRVSRRRCVSNPQVFYFLYFVTEISLFLTVRLRLPPLAPNFHNDN